MNRSLRLKWVLALLLVIGLCSCSETFPVNGHASETRQFYYSGAFVDDYYVNQAKISNSAERYREVPIVLTSSTALSREFEFSDTYDYWPLATDEIHSDLRYFLIFNAMEEYERQFDLDAPYDLTKSPAYKPFMNYGFDLDIADESRTDLYGDTSVLSSYDENTRWLYLKALEKRYEKEPILIDQYANQCFYGYPPADKNRSYLHRPKDKKYCDDVLSKLNAYIPMVSTEQKRSASKDAERYGPIYAQFKLLDLAADDSPLVAFFKSDRISSNKKRRLSKRLLAQIEDMDGSALYTNVFEQGGIPGTYLMNDPGFIMAVSGNAKYLYGSDPLSVNYFYYFDLIESHDYLKYFILGRNEPSSHRYEMEHNFVYEKLKGDSFPFTVARYHTKGKIDKHIFPEPKINCLPNRGVQSVGFNTVTRQSFDCRLKDDAEENRDYVVSYDEQVTMMTVRLSKRRPLFRNMDNYPTTFINVHKQTPEKVKQAMIANQFPNAFVSRLVYMKGKPFGFSHYGYVHHQGVAYYIKIGEDVRHFLEGYL